MRFRLDRHERININIVNNTNTFLLDSMKQRYILMHVIETDRIARAHYKDHSFITCYTINNTNTVNNNILGIGLCNLVAFIWGVVFMGLFVWFFARTNRVISINFNQHATYREGLAFGFLWSELLSNRNRTERLQLQWSLSLFSHVCRWFTMDYEHYVTTYTNSTTSFTCTLYSYTLRLLHRYIVYILLHNALYHVLPIT